METVLKAIALIINLLHDFIGQAVNILGLNLTDKDLHFWLIGLLGMLIFILTDQVFRHLSKLSISTVTFIYTFTLLVVIVFALEIEQRITDGGNMEFADAVAGLKGFIVLFCFYLILKVVVGYFVKLLDKSSN